MNENQKIAYIEVLRCVAALAVVSLHVSCTPFVLCFDSYSEAGRFAVRFLRNLMNWGVPVFVMITGALLVSPTKPLPLKKLFFKYIRRFVLAIALFGTLYAFMEIVFTLKTVSAAGVALAFLNMLSGKSWDHMWYLYMAAGLYALLPLLRGFAESLESFSSAEEEKNSKKIILYTLCALFAVSCVVPYASLFLDFEWNLPDVSVYIFYALLGYAAARWNFTLPKKLCVLFLALYAFYVAAIQFNPFFLFEGNAALKSLGNDSPIVASGAFSVFSLCKSLCRKNELPRLAGFVAPLTFGIYILHPVAVNFCYKVLRLTPAFYPLWISLLSAFAVTVVFSITASYLLRKIWFVRKYIL